MIDLVKHAQHGPGQGSPRQRAVDTGMALTLICLILGLWRDRPGWFVAATTLLVVNMTWPMAYAPAAKLWFGLSALLGSVMSRVILTLVYFAVLTPMGLLRRALGKDTLKLRAFKSGADSVFHTRSGAFTAKDLTTPF